MLRSLIFLFTALLSTTGWAAAESYGFPFDDPFVATVVGTPEEYRADLPEKIPVKRRRMKVFEDREAPEHFWYWEELLYGYALQKGPAPLVFAIAGTGAGYNGENNRIVVKAFYQAGFHVIALSSPTHPNFIVSASGTSVPGHAERDAEDLYRVMEMAWSRLKDRVEVTDFYVTGYSLGGFNAAFVTQLDEERRVFNFKKALLINPPVRLYSSVSLLDRMIENIPGGVDNFAKYYQELMEAFSSVFKRNEKLDFSDDFLYRAYEALEPEDEDLAALIGVAFRLSAASLAFTSDVVTNFGYVKPKNVRLLKNSSPGEYDHVVHRLGFTDFFHEFFYPYYKAKDPTVTRESLVADMSLNSIEDYLRRAKKIEVMHNKDDVILEPGEIDFFPRVFGERAKIYPIGGHCGNMAYKDNVAHMISVFKQ